MRERGQKERQIEIERGEREKERERGERKKS